MANRTRRRAASALVIAVLAVAAIGVANVRANPSPDLPPVAADRLLTSTLEALSQPFTISGDVSTHVDLGIPMLPSSVGGGALGPLGPLSLVAGDQRFRVWRSPDGVRIAHVTDLGEQDLVANARDAWYWDSSTMAATHLAVPQHAPVPANPGMPTGPDVMSIAGEALSAAAPYADVSVGGTSVVAGRPSYDLVVTPRSTLTLIGRIVVAIDAESRLPLRLQVFARGADSPAIENGFASVSFDPIDASMFVFAPPPGATVNQAPDAASAPPTPPLDPSNVRAFGSGFDVRVAYEMATPLPKEIRTLLPFAGPLFSAIEVERGGATWVLVGAMPVATLQQDAAALP